MRHRETELEAIFELFDLTNATPKDKEKFIQKFARGSGVSASSASAMGSSLSAVRSQSSPEACLSSVPEDPREVSVGMGLSAAYQPMTESASHRSD